jgi:hypothetical protein
MLTGVGWTYSVKQEEHKHSIQRCADQVTSFNLRSCRLRFPPNLSSIVRLQQFSFTTSIHRLYWRSDCLWLSTIVALFVWASRSIQLLLLLRSGRWSCLHCIRHQHPESGISLTTRDIGLGPSQRPISAYQSDSRIGLLNPAIQLSVSCPGPD